ncbi:MAG: hypothetical protein J0H12_04235 [Candidatus Paracaedimonas acanthamoebae]|uniref:HTH luxR-type domain-containing protein n=1 Tax=Candidatus Paracaedimonas acanthamoebae TaxID=244581 RepID=A0A8J7PY32_9PROT|nr:hypothetical protein [Candidatus Paracaedimonas acanthamoebae]
MHFQAAGIETVTCSSMKEYVPEIFKDFELNYVETIKDIYFTPREIDVISCLIHGRVVKTIASYLSISAKTVETHIWNIMGKLKCNSQESIRDFIEKTNEISFIRNHYARIRLQTDFEKCLAEIKNYDPKVDRKCIIFFDDNSKNITSFIHKLKKHLSICSLDISVKYRNLNKVFNNTKSTLPFSNYDHIIYIITHKEKLPEITQYPSNLFFLINEGNDSNNISWENPSFNHLNIASYKSYFFLLFDILKQIFPTAHLDSTIHQFQQHYDKFLGAQLVISEPITYTKNELKNKQAYWNKNTIKVAKWVRRHIWLSLTLLGIFVISVVSYMQTNTQEYKNITTPIHTWNLPFPNLYFTGREKELREIAIKFEEADKKDESVSVVVCAGLGGIGKTEIAKYFCHNWKNYSTRNYSLRVWFHAEKLDQLLDSYSALGQKLGITTVDTSSEIIIEKVKEWFEAHPNWLIIYDNAENFDALINFFPQKGGHILITSRHLSWPNVLEVNSLKEEDAINLVGKIINRNENASDIQILVQTLEKMPLAISQAAAYIRENGKTIKDYLQEYSQERYKLLADSTKLPGLHHSPIAITWNISLSRIREESIIAYKLINAFVYLYSDNIPRDHIIDLVPEVKEHPTQIDKAVQALISHSMVKFNAINNNLSLHRLVQEVMWHQQLKDGSQKECLGRVLDVLIQDRDDHLILGGLATRKETMESIIQHYESLPGSRKTALLYHSLGCCYLVKGNFTKAEACFQKGIKKEENSSIYLEYGQALYLRKQFDKAIKYLKLSIEMSHDNFYSYFSEMEKNSIVPILQSEIERIGVVRSKSSHLAYYLLLRIFIDLKNKKEFNFYYNKFKVIAKSYNNAIVTKLFNDILLRSDRPKNS